MEEAKAIDGNSDFDMGVVAGDGSLSNVGPYVFVESSGTRQFEAPHSVPGIYNADTWEKGGAPYVRDGEWKLSLQDVAADDTSSIGLVTIRYCGSCDDDFVIFA